MLYFYILNVVWCSVHQVKVSFIIIASIIWCNLTINATQSLHHMRMGCMLFFLGSFKINSRQRERRSSAAAIDVTGEVHLIFIFFLIWAKVPSATSVVQIQRRYCPLLWLVSASNRAMRCSCGRAGLFLRLARHFAFPVVGSVGLKV